jgi:hypothetical protein
VRRPGGKKTESTVLLVDSPDDAASTDASTSHVGVIPDIKVGTVRVFRHEFTLEDAIGSHACSLEASMYVTNGISLGRSLLLPVGTAICVQTLKAIWCWWTMMQL